MDKIITDRLNSMLYNAGICKRPESEVIQVNPHNVQHWQKRNFKVIGKHYYADHVMAVYMMKGEL
jgi:hypothetical protein